MALIPMFYPDYKSVDDHQKKMSDYWHTLDDKKGLTVVEIINAAYEGDLKGLYIMGENPAMSILIKIMQSCSSKLRLFSPRYFSN